MNHLGQNIAMYRQKKKITQDQLADFLHVTKSSVSKWENDLSSPDLELLCQMATYFDVSVDTLLGYKTNLTKEQIKTIYFDLSDRFANEDFEVVLEEYDHLIERYYNCYEFLEQMVLLLINHLSLAPETQRVPLLEKGLSLCERIMEHAKKETLRQDAYQLRCMLELQLGRPLDVIDQLEEMLSPYALSNSSFVALVNAYQMADQKEKSESFLQSSMYTYLGNFLVASTIYLSEHSGDEKCSETIERMDALMDLYHLETVNPNASAQYHFAVLMTSNTKEERLFRLKKFVDLSLKLVDQGHLSVNQDPYFDQMQEVIEKSDLGSQLVRNQKTIKKDMLVALQSALFEDLKEETVYQQCLEKIEGGL